MAREVEASMMRRTKSGVAKRIGEEDGNANDYEGDGCSNGEMD
jgi:hypothetical protein